MWVGIPLFFVGAFEYVMAAYWTQVLVARDARRTALATFTNVMLWGFVITNLRVEEPLVLVVHGLGCALGAGGTCWWSRRAAERKRAERRRRGKRGRRKVAARVRVEVASAVMPPRGRAREAGAEAR